MLERNGWYIEERIGLRSYCLTQPAEEMGSGMLMQGVFTRAGGVSQGAWGGLNVGHTVGDDPRAVEINHDRLCLALGIEREAITSAQQIHGAHVAQVKPEGRGATYPATDGLITDVPGVALMLRFADCVPVVFFDPRRPAVGLAHAGWRGTLARIAARTVGSMRAAFGSRPEELVVGIGPAIGPCCYEVGPDLADRVCAQFPQWPDLIRWSPDNTMRDTKEQRPYLDLWTANLRQLEEAGVHSVAVAQCCTSCHEDEFYSHRATCLTSRRSSSSGLAGRGRTGRFAAVIGLRAA